MESGRSTLAGVRGLVAAVAGGAHAVVGAGRVDAQRARRAGRARRAALVHVALAARAAEPARARALLARHARAAVQAPARADR